MHRSGRGEVEREDFAIEVAQLCLILGQSFLDCVVIGALLTGEGHTPITQSPATLAKGRGLSIQALQFLANLTRQLDLGGRVAVIFQQAVAKGLLARVWVDIEVEWLPQAAQVAKIAALLGCADLLLDMIRETLATPCIGARALLVGHRLRLGFTPVFKIHKYPPASGITDLNFLL